MSLQIKRQGDYHLYETRHRHSKILLLGKQTCEWVSGSRGDWLRLSELRPESDHSIGEGRYFVLLPHNETGLQDNTEYLALSNSGAQYYLYKLPDGFPTTPILHYTIVPLNRTLHESLLQQAQQA